MYERVAANQRRSWALVLGFVAFALLAGWLFGEVTGWGWFGLAGALALAVAMSAGSYWNSDRLVLAVSRARPASESEERQVHNLVEALCLGAGIPKPRLYVVDDPAPNAFATGRSPEHAAVAVTTGLLEKMNRDELEGVLAHELSHVRNRDTLVMTLAVTLVGVLVLLSDWLIRAMWWGGAGAGGGRRGGGRGNAGALIAIAGLVLLVLAPAVAQLLRFAISRRREYLADADAVLLTRHPEGMIAALEKLRDDTTVVRSAGRATAHLWIESPIPRHAHEGGSETPGSGAWLNRLFETHPPLEARIEALRRSALGTYDARAG
jgi:heat shock protein HtpX